MRLLHVLAESGYSGGEIQLEHLVRHLHAKGHEQAFVLVPGAKFTAVAEDIGAEIHLAKLRRPWTTLAGLRTRRAVKRFAPDVLHLGCGRSLLWGGLWCLGLGVALRATTRRIDYPIGRSLYRGGRYRHLVDHTAANCISVRNRVLDAGVPEDRVTLVHEGIDVVPWLRVREDREAARERLGIPTDAVVLSCAATLRPRKGQRELIDAFVPLASQYPKAILILAGSGTDLEALRQKANATGLGDRIRVPGPIKPVADLYAASDVSLMPSFHEGLSNACLEASAAGLPLIVSNVGGLPEIVEDGVTGTVVPPGDLGALREALGYHLSDPDFRERAGAAGRERTCARFTAERMAQGMETLFLRLLDA